MSEILSVYSVTTDDHYFCFDTVEAALDCIREEITGCACCLGDEMSFKFTVGEMERSQFEALPEFEG